MPKFATFICFFTKNTLSQNHQNFFLSNTVSIILLNRFYILYKNLSLPETLQPPINFLFSFCIKFHISKSSNVYLFYFFIYYHFNMQYCSLFQLKKRKNLKFWIFLCLLCAHSKFFMTQLYDIMLFSKIFFMTFWHLLGI